MQVLQQVMLVALGIAFGVWAVMQLSVKLQAYLLIKESEQVLANYESQ